MARDTVEVESFNSLAISLMVMACNQLVLLIIRTNIDKFTAPKISLLSIIIQFKHL